MLRSAAPADSSAARRRSRARSVAARSNSPSSADRRGRLRAEGAGARPEPVRRRAVHLRGRHRGRARRRDRRHQPDRAEPAALLRARLAGREGRATRSSGSGCRRSCSRRRRSRWSGWSGGAPSAATPRCSAPAVFAIAPFAVYYGSEARAYSALTCLALASTYALLRALDGNSRWWWAAFAAATAAVMYTHYTGVFVLLAQTGVGAVVPPRPLAGDRHLRRRRGGLLPAVAAVHPRERARRHHQGRLPAHPAELRARAGPALPGPPVRGDRPGAGRAGLALVLAGRGGGRGVRARPVPARPAAAASRVVLLIALAVASSIGTVLADWAGQPIYLPRNLIASLPALCLLVALLVRAAPRPAALASAALLARRTGDRRPPGRAGGELTPGVQGGGPLGRRPRPARAIPSPRYPASARAGSCATRSASTSRGPIPCSPSTRRARRRWPPRAAADGCS